MGGTVTSASVLTRTRTEVELKTLKEASKTIENYGLYFEFCLGANASLTAEELEVARHH